MKLSLNFNESTIPNTFNANFLSTLRAASVNPFKLYSHRYAAALIQNQLIQYCSKHFQRNLWGNRFQKSKFEKWGKCFKFMK